MFNTCKYVNYVNIYKPFGSVEHVNKTNNYKLLNIKELYESLFFEKENVHENKDLYFLDESGKEIKVLNIEKEDYSGFIYDVDVPNDIVLVRHKSWIKDNDNYVQVQDSGNDRSQILEMDLAENGVEKPQVLDAEEVQKSGNLSLEFWTNSKVENNKNKNSDNYIAIFKTCFNPITVNPTISLESCKYLTTIPEPKSRLNAFLGLPNEISNTSASLSYSQETFSGFSTTNFSILLTSFLKHFDNKQLVQIHQIEKLPYKLQQDIYYLLQGFSQTFSQPKESRYLPSEQDQDCLLYLLSNLQHYPTQDDNHKYALNALLSLLLEHHSLKKQSSFNHYINDNYKNLSVENNENEKCYKHEWKLFKDLNKNGLVATLNQETHEIQYQKPTAYQNYNVQEEIYRIKTEYSSLLVLLKHKIYAKIKDKASLGEKIKPQILEINWAGKPQVLDAEEVQKSGNLSLEFWKELYKSVFMVLYSIKLEVRPQILEGIERGIEGRDLSQFQERIGNGINRW